MPCDDFSTAPTPTAHRGPGGFYVLRSNLACRSHADSRTALPRERNARLSPLNPGLKRGEISPSSPKSHPSKLLSNRFFPRGFRYPEAVSE